MYAYAFCEEFILLYPLYAVLFTNHGLTTAEISSLFIIWSATAVVLEIPSGVLADMFSRRLLLVVGPILMGAGFGLWVAVPSYWTFAVGFVLWGIHGALQSGAFEALVFEELDALGRAPEYARVVGRAQAAATMATALAMAAAAPVFGAGGYPALGAASVAACVVTSLLAMTLPEHRRQRAAERTNEFLRTLRAGVCDVRSNPRLRLSVLFLIVVSAVWGVLDEYVPLLADEGGVAEHDIPVLVLAVYLGVAAGGLLGGVGGRLSRHGLAGLLVLAAVALAVGALTNGLIGFALIGISFCVFQMTEIVTDARIQHLTNGDARSTVTSVAGFGVEVAAIGVYAVYALGSGLAGHGVIFAVAAGVYVLLAAPMLRPTP